jgi:hypothetical protein
MISILSNYSLTQVSKLLGFQEDFKVLFFKAFIKEMGLCVV